MMPSEWTASDFGTVSGASYSVGRKLSGACLVYVNGRSAGDITDADDKRERRTK